MPNRWTWSKVSTIHQAANESCTGAIFSYAYRCHPPTDRSYERCIGLAWCTVCRRYSGAMVFIPRDEELPDALAGLPLADRERIARSEVRLLDYLDRLVRRGLRAPRRGVG